MGEPTVLVLGSTDSVGRRVVERLGARGVPVRAASLRGRVRFDWTDPDTWEGALDGASAIHVMAPDGVRVDPEFLEYAVRHGVRRLTLLSGRGIEQANDRRLLDAERAVGGSGAEWTILRADRCDQDFDEGVFAQDVRAGRITVPVGDTRQAFVDAGDVAAVAATVLTGEGHAGRIYEVTGPRALGFAEAAATISEAAGYEVVFDGSPEAYARVLREAGTPVEAAEAMTASFTALAEGGDALPTETVSRVTGRPPRDFTDYAAGAAPAWWRGQSRS
ncbi:NmrA family transcriptional regulator [Nocardiopsis sp. N85]|uniref:NmrA family transcriptional regulator n=1 Tax=Nocardiopsis sp. N85 TaxID=3029400 RepID=UPI00237F754E|nr:NmrA family transcriptional regulator [Nocardiopsis sp. N85]MDE3722174.1 NmrA family transcriptional regulator [Nocardiopsis sp. N85]